MKPNLRTLSIFLPLLISLFAVRANFYEGHVYSGEVGNGRIAFVSNRDGNREIYSMNSDGSDVIRLTYNDWNELDPDWSPDGSKIAFASYRVHDTRPIQIYVMDADGSHVTNLTNSAMYSDRYPSWSPDGTQIAFTRYIRQAADLYVINSDGSGLLKIVDGGGEIYTFMPTWSPDGSEIMFTSGRSEDVPVSTFGALTTHKVNADGSGEMRISAGYTNTYGNLDWSWVNDKIAYYDATASGTAIFIMDSSIANIVRVTPSSDSEEGYGQFHENPSWSPDGSKIAFESVLFRPGPTSEIYIVDIATTGALTNITNNPDADDTSPDWGPIFTMPSATPPNGVL